MEYKKQHIIPQSYLAAWTDPQTPANQEPYVWEINKKSLSIRNKSPKNILYEVDFYTTTNEEGGRDVSIEKILSTIEGNFVKVRDNKIFNELPITTQERIEFLTFVAAMHSRTPSSGDRWSYVWNQLLDTVKKFDAIYYDEDYDPSKITAPNPAEIDEGKIFTASDIEEIVDNPITSLFYVNVTREVKLLWELDMAIFITDLPQGYITSDNPVVWADPQRFKRPKQLQGVGLSYPSIEITMPISPSYNLFLNRQGANGYINLQEFGPHANIDTVINANQRICQHAKESIVTNENRILWKWFF